MEAENGRRKRTFLVKDDCNARLTGGVRRALGREPWDFADYARARPLPQTCGPGSARTRRPMDGFLFALTLFAALGCGVMAGAFFAFSAFVMRALARLPAQQGIAAMQAINVAAVTPAFMTALFGTALACGALIVSSLLVWDEPFAGYLLTGGALYLLGAIGPTGVYHVPRNEALAEIEPSSVSAEAHWSRYLRGWTTWNHLRFAAALAASATLVIALRVPHV